MVMDKTYGFAFQSTILNTFKKVGVPSFEKKTEFIPSYRWYVNVYASFNLIHIFVIGHDIHHFISVKNKS